MPLRILLNGHHGRMGQALLAAAPAADAIVSARLEVGDTLDDKHFAEVDVVLDFSSHEATWPLAQLAARHAVPLVIGTTGHTDAERAGILGLAQKIPIVLAGNFSVGVNLLNFLVRRAAAALGRGFDVEIIEMHHRDKKDAPSGTAQKLIELVRQAHACLPADIRYGRHGETGTRPQNEIGVHSLRGGDVVGDHTVIFAGDGERLELTHRASQRTIFAVGALRAAQWVQGRTPGLYGMDDVLGLSG
jgi:4-hydroxy-tetrahydrodipicolinate reductase